ncbi:MAG: hypothetical protein HOV83_07190 [Catenulispora sp.]|nr:hypothetical protein [Catenulispora sp.]
MAAARRAGHRYWKLLITAHLLRILAAPVAILAGVALIGLLVWQVSAGNVAWLHSTLRAAGRLDWPSLLRWAALATGLLWAGWLARDVVTGAGVRRRATGQHHRLPAYAAGTAVVLLAASLLIR